MKDQCPFCAIAPPGFFSGQLTIEVSLTRSKRIKVCDHHYAHIWGNPSDVTDSRKPKIKCTETLVCEDIKARQEVGLAKYGVTVADNPLPLKEWLEHAYTETLDKAVYLKRAIQEMEDAQ